MKKFVVLLNIALLLSTTSALAKNVKVMAMSKLSTANPPQSWSVKVMEPFVTQNGYSVHEGSIITGKITDVMPPKRLKRDASFKFIPVSFYDIETEKTYSVDKDIVGKYNALGDVKPGQVLEKGAIAAGNHFISSTIGPGIALVEGAVKNEQGNRAKSAAVSVYESTPLSYINKGKEMYIEEGQVFLMSFKSHESDDNAEEELD